MNKKYFSLKISLTWLIPVHLIDIYNVIEAVRDAGLNAVELNAGISVTRLENLVSSLFNQLSKRLPTTHTINPRESTVLLVEFLLAAIDRLVQTNLWILWKEICVSWCPPFCTLTSCCLNVKHISTCDNFTILCSSVICVCVCVFVSVSQIAVWRCCLWRQCWPHCVEGNW